ncbi:hypothetical protein [Telluribacter sp. SYSU D00476]|uniref:hypothetical protein n=1 Tax=Telluribacter sp. SYSU D00476 TaxID=2811430 RepID=UPI001FF3777E|nr:hypothetical protein [Telluribacter sp. SYSU D00476]
MATMVHLDGTDFMINLDHVVGIKRIHKDGKYGIQFITIDSRKDVWEFRTQDLRDETFISLIHTDQGRVFKSGDEEVEPGQPVVGLS